MKPSVKFIYFDLAGVQFDFLKGMTKLAQSQGLTYEKFADLVKDAEEKAQKGRITTEELFKHYNEVLNLNIADKSEYLEMWTDFFTPIIPVHKLIKNLISEYEIGIITNIHEGLFEKLSEKNLIADISYKHIIQSFELGFVKPEKEIYLLAQKQAGVFPEEILLVDDDTEYVNAAKKLKWQGVFFEGENINKSITLIKNCL